MDVQEFLSAQEAHASAYTMTGVDDLKGAAKDTSDSGFSNLGTLFYIIVPLLIWAFGKKFITRHAKA